MSETKRHLEDLSVEMGLDGEITDAVLEEARRRDVKSRVGINDFVRRQTKESRFSYYDGTFEEVAAMAEANFALAKPGYRDGVLLVPVAPEKFYSAVSFVMVGDVLKAECSARKPGEDPFIHVLSVDGPKSPALVVDLVLEDNSASTDCEWELISINARESAGEEPLTPVAMVRNFLGLVGGTKAVYTAEDFAKSIFYWSRRAMVAGSD